MARKRDDYRGPYTGAQLCRVLERFGYELYERPAVDEMAVYVFPMNRASVVVVNEEWQFDIDDPIFRVVARDLRRSTGISERVLHQRLNDEVAH